MGEMFQRLSKKFQVLVKSGRSTAHKLNYFTLKIDSEEITKDLFNHSLEQKISIFWLANFFAAINFITSVISYALQGKQDLGPIITSVIYLIGIGPAFAIFRWRFKRAIRFLPVIIFLAITVYLSLCTSWFGAKKLVSAFEQDGELIEALNIAYIVCTFILC